MYVQTILHSLLCVHENIFLPLILCPTTLYSFSPCKNLPNCPLQKHMYKEGQKHTLLPALSWIFSMFDV